MVFLVVWNSNVQRMIYAGKREIKFSVINSLPIFCCVLDFYVLMICDFATDLESDKDVRSRDRPARKKPRLNFTLKKNEKGETPLHVAAAKGNYSLVISLLKQVIYDK